MSSPSQEQLKKEALEKFVDDYFNAFTAEKKFEILQVGLGITFIEGEWNDWVRNKNE